MFAVLATRVRTMVGRMLKSARAAVRDVIRPAPMAAGLVRDVLRSRDELLAENALLRQQLIVATRKVKRPELRRIDRGIMVARSPAAILEQRCHIG